MMINNIAVALNFILSIVKFRRLYSFKMLTLKGLFKLHESNEKFESRKFYIHFFSK